ncbi:MAG: class I SAM-dependent methyltransferase, partial [Terracidiphilus sp.]
MLPDEIFARLGALPYMRLDEGRMFYDFIIANRLHIGLELGFFHGVSTAYLAGAIQDIGSGNLITIDLTKSKEREPNIEWVLEVTGLSHLVQVFYEPKSFNWRLMKMLEEDRYESFDFCYIDGGHSWYDTGFAFCLVERLLKPGGWVVFDDLHYNFRDFNSQERLFAKRMPEEEQTTPQIERVFELLVEPNPYFGSFRRLGRFGFAQKRLPVWSLDQRSRNHEDLIVSRALERARSDPEYRMDLIQSPAEALSNLTGEPGERFQNLRFVETDYLAPTFQKVEESGTTVVYL